MSAAVALHTRRVTGPDESITHVDGPPPSDEKVIVEGQAKETPEINLPPGTLVDGTYRVLGKIGEGGMGVVYHALDERLEREVALKLILPERLSRNGLREQFVAEARAMARVRHPNTVEIHTFGELHGHPYFVMEYVPGTNLEAWIARQPPGGMDVDTAVGVLEQLCRGVAAIHDAGALHRDVKPSNVLIGPAFRVAITDLGLARPRDEVSTLRSVAGTPAYMAPEIALLEDVPPELRHRADVYAIGVIAFEMLAGRLPFTGRTAMAIMNKHVHDPAPSLADFRPDLPAAFSKVIAAALAKRPEDRIEDAHVLRRELLRARQLVQSRQPPLRLLVVDDDPRSREWTAEILGDELAGAEVITLRDGSEALAYAQQHVVSAIITDLHMPGMNGAELTASLRADSRTSAIPVVVMTGVGSALDWQVLQQMGAEAFLVKPVDVTALVAVVRRVARPLVPAA